jgi:hypothetical protein
MRLKSVNVANRFRSAVVVDKKRRLRAMWSALRPQRACCTALQFVDSGLDFLSMPRDGDTASQGRGSGLLASMHQA